MGNMDERSVQDRTPNRIGLLLCIVSGTGLMADCSNIPSNWARINLCVNYAHKCVSGTGNNRQNKPKVNLILAQPTRPFVQHSW